MRPLFLVFGAILFLLGTAWALQGAYVIPATFMRGPAWILIGVGLASVGLALALLGFRSGSKRAEGT